MPEVPEVQAHAERLTAALRGAMLARFEPLAFTVLKTVEPRPDDAYGSPLCEVGRRGKYLLATFDEVTFVVHLMQGGRLVIEAPRRAGKKPTKPRGAQARFVFEHEDGSSATVLLTEQGTERKAGVWCVPTPAALTTEPLASLGPEADGIDAAALTARLAATPSTRIHGWLRDQHNVAGIGRRLANEICHRAKLSPFAMSRKLDATAVAAVTAAIADSIADGLAAERARDDMSRSKDRPSRVHGRTGETCDQCGDTIRAVEYSSYTVNYCPRCQTGRKILADNTTSKFLK